MSELRLGFVGDEQAAAANVRSLASWLRDTENLARAEIKERRSAREGTLGSGVDLVQVIATNAAVTAAVVTAYANWLAERIKRGSVRVRVECSDGLELETTVRNPAEVAQVRERLLNDC